MKKAIMLLHGFLTDDKDFGRLYDFLPERYDIVRRVLIPGHGNGADLKDFIARDAVKHVEAEFDRLSGEAEIIDVIGFSMGGALAVHLSTVRAFRNLILLAPANKFLNWHVMFQSMSFYVKKTNEAIQSSDKALIETPGDIQKALSCYIENEKISFDITKKRLLPNYNYHTLSNFGKVVKRCNDGLFEINNPTLILWGKLDQLVPMDSCVSLYSLCKNPKSHLDIFPDLSHLMLNSTNDEMLIRKITTFIDQNDDESTYRNARDEEGLLYKD